MFFSSIYLAAPPTPPPPRPVRPSRPALGPSPAPTPLLPPAAPPVTLCHSSTARAAPRLSTPSCSDPDPDPASPPPHAQADDGAACSRPPRAALVVLLHLLPPRPLPACADPPSRTSPNHPLGLRRRGTRPRLGFGLPPDPPCPPPPAHLLQPLRRPDQAATARPPAATARAMPAQHPGPHSGDAGAPSSGEGVATGEEAEATTGFGDPAVTADPPGDLPVLLLPPLLRAGGGVSEPAPSWVPEPASALGTARVPLSAGAATPLAPPGGGGLVGAEGAGAPPACVCCSPVLLWLVWWAGGAAVAAVAGGTAAAALPLAAAGGSVAACDGASDCG